MPWMTFELLYNSEELIQLTKLIAWVAKPDRNTMTLVSPKTEGSEMLVAGKVISK